MSIIAWVSNLSTAGKVGLGLSSLVGLSIVGGTATPSIEPEIQDQAVVQQAQHDDFAPEDLADDKPLTEKRTVSKREILGFRIEEVQDSSVPKGQTVVVTEGEDGEKTIEYEVVYENGEEISRRKISEVVNRSPVDKVVHIGTYVAPKPQPVPQSQCDPNYSGCVPIASDVDCAGGSGNGPAYVRGPVSVIGVDIYGLDGDNDGIGCE